MADTVTPLFARVLLKRESIQAKTKILIPQTVEKRNAPAKGVVSAKGPAADASIKVGAKVIFGQHAGAWIDVDGEELYICADEDILVILE